MSTWGRVGMTPAEPFTGEPTGVACDVPGCSRSPLPASRLCASCRFRFVLSVESAPGQARALQGLIDSPSVPAVSYRGDADARRGTRVGPPVSIPIEPISLLAELRDLLAALVALLLADQPGLNPPGGRAVFREDWRWMGRVDSDPDQGWYEVTPRLVPSSIEAMVAWLLLRLPICEALADVGPLVGRFHDVMGAAYVLAPHAAGPAGRIPKVPCPWCRQSSLADYSTSAGVFCTSCEVSISAAHYAAWCATLAAERLV